MRLAVVIPSRNLDNLVPCVRAVRRHEPDVPVTVVSDGLDFEALVKARLWNDLDPMEIVEGAQPFVYARNINIGLRDAAERDQPDAFVLLNDDALLITPQGFTHLARAAEEHPEYGIISAVTNHVGNPAQLPKNAGLREEPGMLCFVCVLITAQTLARVGFLDERFTAYGWEDNDYCRRCRMAGIKLAIDDSCFVDHTGLRSSFRSELGATISAGAAIYRDKWGDLL